MARGFQEIEKPQSDSPTVVKESLKLLITLAANNDFKLASMDISKHTGYRSVHETPR